MTKIFKCDLNKVIETARLRVVKPRRATAIVKVNLVVGGQEVAFHCTARRTPGVARVTFHANGRAVDLDEAAALFGSHNSDIDAARLSHKRAKQVEYNKRYRERIRSRDGSNN